MAIPFNLPSEEDTEEYYRRLDQLLADLYDVIRHILLRPRGQVQHQQQNPPTREPRGNDAGGGEPPGGGGGDSHDGGGGGIPAALEQRLCPLPDLVADTTTSACVSQPSSDRHHPHHHYNQGHHTVGHQGQFDEHLHTDERHPRPPPRRPPRSSRRRSSSPRSKKSCCALKVSHSLKTSAENWVLVGHELRKIAEEFRTTSKTSEEEKMERIKERRVEVKASSLFSLLVPMPFCGSVWTTVILLVGWRLLMRHR